MEIKYECECWENDTHFIACCEEHHYQFIFNGHLEKKTEK